MAECRSCHAPIIWAVTEKGGKMPVDADPVPDGNVELVERPGAAPLAKVHKQPPLGVDELRLNHFVTCPDAKNWKKK